MYVQIHHTLNLYV